MESTEPPSPQPTPSEQSKPHTFGRPPILVNTIGLIEAQGRANLIAADSDETSPLIKTPEEIVKELAETNATITNSNANIEDRKIAVEKEAQLIADAISYYFEVRSGGYYPTVDTESQFYSILDFEARAREVFLATQDNQVTPDEVEAIATARIEFHANLDSVNDTLEVGEAVMGYVPEGQRDDIRRDYLDKKQLGIDQRLSPVLTAVRLNGGPLEPELIELEPELIESVLDSNRQVEDLQRSAIIMRRNGDEVAAKSLEEGAKEIIADVRKQFFSKDIPQNPNPVEDLAAGEVPDALTRRPSYNKVVGKTVLADPAPPTVAKLSSNQRSVWETGDGPSPKPPKNPKDKG